LEAISNDEPFGSSDEDLIDDPESQIKDVDEDLYQVIGTKVGTLRFKCSVCSHKSRYKQGIPFKNFLATCPSKPGLIEW
jgi:hypothetical protein